MINLKEVIFTVNSIIKRTGLEVSSSITHGDHIKPNYSMCKVSPKICLLKLDACSKFCETLEKSEKDHAICPLGFTVKFKSYKISSKYKKVNLFTLVDFNYNTEITKYLQKLPRTQKKETKQAIDELETYTIDKKAALQKHNYLSGLIDTLLIGRIGISMQSMSHQIFTPLQGAMSDVQNIENNNITEGTIQRLVKNFDSINKLAQQIQMLLSTSQVFNANMLRRVTVHKMIAEITQMLQQSAEDKKIQIKTSFNNHGTTVEAIPDQIYIVLSNIIHNAIKYSFNGFDTAPLPINIYYESDNKHLIICIENEGCQITKEEITERNIFELGYRGIHSGDRQRRGSGTGLFVANEIVSNHMGRIDVFSNYKGGTHHQDSVRFKNTFKIFWPYIIVD